MPFGIDGARGGWVRSDGRLFARLADAIEGCDAVALDMPIGLLDARAPGGRPCDREARAWLRPRGSAVFSPPTRAALSQPFAQAGVSLQCYHLFPKLREVDALLTPRLQRRVRESHPELAFARLAGKPLAPKRTPLGRRQRERLVGRPPRVPGAKPDDVLDAMVLARVAAEPAPLALGGEKDARGLRMEIVTLDAPSCMRRR